MSSSALLIGAGVFGLTTACELRRRRWTVTVLDAGRVPRDEAASTDVSKIIRMDYGADVLYTAMSEAAMAGWDEWNERWSPALYHQDGFVLLASEPMRPGGFEFESYTLLKQRGHPVTRLSDLDRVSDDSCVVRRPLPRRLLQPSGRLGGKRPRRRTPAARGARPGRARGRGCPLRAPHRDRRAGARRADDNRRRPSRGRRRSWPRAPGPRALLPHLADVMWTTAQPVIHVDAGLDDRWRAPKFPVWAADIARTGWYGFPALPGGALKIGHHGSGRRVEPDAAA